MSDALKDMIRHAEIEQKKMEMHIRFTKNMEVFSQYAPKLAKMVDQTELKEITIGVDPLENFNIFDKGENQFFYGIEPQKFAENQVDSFCNSATPLRFEHDISDDPGTNSIHIKHLNKLIKKLKEINLSEKKVDDIYSLILCGVGFGLHINEVVKRKSIVNLFIYEPSIEVFKTSFFYADWEKIFLAFQEDKRQITFSIGDSYSEALEKFEKNIRDNGLFNYMANYVIQHTRRKSETDFINFFKTEAFNFVAAQGYFDDEQISLAHGIHNLKSEHAVFTTTQPHFRKTPILIIGNGPSLDEHIDFLTREQDKSILISCGSAITSLCKLGIKPDFHVEQERGAPMKDFIEIGTTPAFRKGITLLCLHTVHPSMMTLFDETCYAVKPNDVCSEFIKDYYRPHRASELGFCNPTVTNCGLSFALAMGFMNVYLIGIDLGKPIDGNHHSTHSTHYDIEEIKDDNTNNNFSYEKEAYIEVPGNFEKTVLSQRVLNLSRKNIERFLTQVYRAFPEFNCYNSNNGAKISGAQTIHQKDIASFETLDKKRLTKELKNDHFLVKKNLSKEKWLENSSLDVFFKLEKDLYISENRHQSIYEELYRVFNVVKQCNDEVAYYLLKGTLQSYLSCISQFCLSRENTKEQTHIITDSIQGFNQMIKEIYQTMHTSPFELDSSAIKILDTLKSINSD